MKYRDAGSFRDGLPGGIPDGFPDFLEIVAEQFGTSLLLSEHLQQRLHAFELRRAAMKSTEHRLQQIGIPRRTIRPVLPEI